MTTWQRNLMHSIDTRYPKHAHPLALRVRLLNYQSSRVGMKPRGDSISFISVRDSAGTIRRALVEYPQQNLACVATKFTATSGDVARFAQTHYLAHTILVMSPSLYNFWPSRGRTQNWSWRIRINPTNGTRRRFRALQNLPQVTACDICCHITWTTQSTNITLHSKPTKPRSSRHYW
jgi:hypothetical protein